MSVSLFISIFVGGGLVNILLTQAIKQFYYNRGSEASPNMIALIDALVVGCLGTAFVYMLMGIDWTVNNVLCLIAMIVLVWMGSMIGYSKIIQTIQQFRAWRNQIDSGKDILDTLQDMNGEIEK
ncbi:MAG: hypothetical protein IJA72_01675 [Clostridia bacterium]|nr:hypothetical protein [Clostridia bacterium]